LAAGRGRRQPWPAVKIGRNLAPRAALRHNDRVRMQDHVPIRLTTASTLRRRRFATAERCGRHARRSCPQRSISPASPDSARFFSGLSAPRAPEHTAKSHPWRRAVYWCRRHFRNVAGGKSAPKKRPPMRRNEARPRHSCRRRGRKQCDPLPPVSRRQAFN